MDASPIRIIESPPLHEPILVAAWPGLGLVGLKTVQFLHEQFPSTLLAEIEAPEFFRVAGVKIDAGLLLQPELPSSRFFHVSVPGALHDVLIFIGDDQPAPGKEFAFANLVVDVAQHFGVRRIYTAAAMVTNLNHTQPSRVWAAGTTRHVLEDLPRDGYVELQEGQIGGLNGLLLGVAGMRHIEGCCLLGEIPYYVTNLENPKASAVILSTLASVLHLKLDLSTIEQKAVFVESQIDQAVRQVSAGMRSGGTEEDGTEGGGSDDGAGGSETPQGEDRGPIN